LSREPARRLLRRLAVLLAAALPLVGCDDDLPGPEPGTLIVVITSPHGAEGAALLRVDQPVEWTAGGLVSVYERESAGGVILALVRQVAGPLQIELEVVDLRDPPTVELLQVAGPDDELRTDLDLYTVELRR
jgi:hypothetical protein